MSDDQADLDQIPPIDVFDPMAVMFAHQHDFRERFLRALTEILGVQVEGKSYKDALMKVRQIAVDALDPSLIAEWELNNRPLPWLDDVVGEDARELTAAVLGTLDGEPGVVPFS